MVTFTHPKYSLLYVHDITILKYYFCVHFIAQSLTHMQSTFSKSIIGLYDRGIHTSWSTPQMIAMLPIVVLAINHVHVRNVSTHL